MGFADDMGRLRSEIEELRSARIALKNRLNHYAGDLRRGMNEQRSAMHQQQTAQAAMTRAAMESFVSNTRRTMREMMGSFQRERDTAHRAWMRMPGH
jgi:hypothetical protein